MKTIELPDYLADALIATGKEMAHQNNLGTSWPVWYVSEVVKTERPSGEGEYKERLDLDLIDIDKQVCETCKNEWHDNGELPEQCNDMWCMDTFWYYDLRRDYTTYGSAFFFTQKACQEYIDDNHYHFNKPMPYAVSAHRNDELQPIIQALIVAAGEQVPANHYGRLKD